VSPSAWPRNYPRVSLKKLGSLRLTKSSTFNLHRRMRFAAYASAALVSIGADAYYAVTSEAITTVAHICALLLGALLGWLYLRSFPTEGTASEPLLSQRKS